MASNQALDKLDKLENKEPDPAAKLGPQPELKPTAQPAPSPSEVKSDAAPAETKKSFATALWVNTTYFSEGLPLMIVLKLSSVFFTDIGMDLKSIGYLNFLGTPWNVKFLWAPFVDILSTKRRWLIALQCLIALMTAALGMVSYMMPVGGDITRHITFISIIFIGLAFISATNDIAIDGFYLDGIPNQRDQAAYTGYRVMAYRIAMIFANTALVAIAAISANKYLSWFYAFGVAALTMIALAIFHAIYLPRSQAQNTHSTKPGEIMKSFVRAFSTYLQQERVAIMLIFIITYKIGDEVLFSMKTPFMMRELGVTKLQLSWINGFVGMACAIAGTMLGAWWIKKAGLKRAIWPLTLLMNINIWAYIWLAYAKPNPATSAGIATIAFVIGYEEIAAGLGNAVLLIYLLRTCKLDFKAAHYAIGSAIMSIPSRLVGGMGGIMVLKLGYTKFFILAFLVSIPAMMLLFWVPLKEEQTAEKPKAA